MPTFTELESIATELLAQFDITSPPVPIESILQRPLPGMWEELDVSQLSSGFLVVTENYSPRMSLARLLARHVANSAWGMARELHTLIEDEQNLQRFSRMLIMPATMLAELHEEARTPQMVSVYFEVPEEDARLRLLDIATHAS